ncbi:MAG: SRPBCC domain-containing protein [Microcella sp.]|uniref:SRPBCC domain-containing protein n=1 Tax=Microcella sp. TaxID=1913979 RepID=UPI0033152499
MTATAERSVFRSVVSVEVAIAAAPDVVWNHLVDAADHVSWNSTVDSIDGTIAPGQRIAIRVPVAPGRTFRPRVVEWQPPHRMVWRDGSLPLFRGDRTFSIAQTDHGCTFTMTEELRGMLVPLIAPSLPDFAPVFDRYAADLREVSERT